MTIHDLLKQQGDALDKGDIPEAQSLLADIKEEVESVEGQAAWRLLRRQGPSDYDGLMRRLELARASLAESGRIEVGQLIEVFKRCQDHGIPLADLEVREHLSKYREASAHLNSIIRADSPAGEERQKLEKALAEVRADPNRDATRKRVRRRY
jgi:phosphoenolpyruvate carboxylase